MLRLKKILLKIFGMGETSELDIHSRSSPDPKPVLV